MKGSVVISSAGDGEPHQRTAADKWLNRLAVPRCQAGSIFAEYVVILAVVAIACAFAIVALGRPLVGYFAAQAAMLGLPIP